MDAADSQNHFNKTEKTRCFSKSFLKHAEAISHLQLRSLCLDYVLALNPIGSAGGLIRNMWLQDMTWYGSKFLKLQTVLLSWHCYLQILGAAVVTMWHCFETTYRHRQAQKLHLYWLKSETCNHIQLSFVGSSYDQASFRSQHLFFIPQDHFWPAHVDRSWWQLRSIVGLWLERDSTSRPATYWWRIHTEPPPYHPGPGSATAGFEARWTQKIPASLASPCLSTIAPSDSTTARHPGPGSGGKLYFRAGRFVCCLALRRGKYRLWRRACNGRGRTAGRSAPGSIQLQAWLGDLRLAKAKVFNLWLLVAGSNRAAKLWLCHMVFKHWLCSCIRASMVWLL